MGGKGNAGAVVAPAGHIGQFRQGVLAGRRGTAVEAAAGVIGGADLFPGLGAEGGRAVEVVVQSAYRGNAAEGHILEGICGICRFVEFGEVVGVDLDIIAGGDVIPDAAADIGSRCSADGGNDHGAGNGIGAGAVGGELQRYFTGEIAGGGEGQVVDGIVPDAGVSAVIVEAGVGQGIAGECGGIAGAVAPIEGAGRGGVFRLRGRAEDHIADGIASVALLEQVVELGPVEVDGFAGGDGHFDIPGRSRGIAYGDFHGPLFIIAVGVVGPEGNGEGVAVSRAGVGFECQAVNGVIAVTGIAVIEEGAGIGQFGAVEGVAGGPGIEAAVEAGICVGRVEGNIGDGAVGIAGHTAVGVIEVAGPERHAAVYGNGIADLGAGGGVDGELENAVHIVARGIVGPEGNIQAGVVPCAGIGPEGQVFNGVVSAAGVLAVVVEPDAVVPEVCPGEGGVSGVELPGEGVVGAGGFKRNIAHVTAGIGKELIDVVEIVPVQADGASRRGGGGHGVVGAVLVNDDFQSAGGVVVPGVVGPEVHGQGIAVPRAAVCLEEQVVKGIVAVALGVVIEEGPVVGQL